MLQMIYSATAAGAPSNYGDATDQLQSAARVNLQGFPKVQAGFALPQPALTSAIDGWLAQRGVSAKPVVVMVHGFLYDPSQPLGSNSDNPVESVYGMPPGTQYSMSWLPLVGECTDNGGNHAENAIAFCYKSESGMAEYGSAAWTNNYQYAVFDQAPLAARALATILFCLGSHNVTVRVLAHSLGTRTLSQAIRLLRARMPNNLDRVVLLDGAEFCVDAAANFDNCGFDVFNIANRSDQVLAIGAQQMCNPFRSTGSLESQVIGFAGLGTTDRWLDLQLDSQPLVNWFAAANAPDGLPYTIQAEAQDETHPFAGLDHWACYTNDGNRALLRDLLFSDVMTVAQLKQLGVPSSVDSAAYGRFRQVAPPATPQSRRERQRLLYPVTIGAGGGG